MDNSTKQKRGMLEYKGGTKYMCIIDFPKKHSFNIPKQQNYTAKNARSKFRTKYMPSTIIDTYHFTIQFTKFGQLSRPQNMKM